MAKSQSHLLNKSLSAIAIINSMRSGGNMLNRLLDSHPQILTNHSETFFGVFSDTSEKSKYQIRKFKKIYSKKKNIKNIFETLIENDFNHLKASKNGWIKTNYNKPLNYKYNQSLHFKNFQKKLKNNSNYGYREILDIYTISFFESFSNLKTSGKKYFNTYWPNFSLYKINLKNFNKIYPDGYMIFIIRDPLQWAASCKKRRPNQFSMKYMRTYYERPILNCLNYIKLKNKILLVDFKDLIFNTEKIMKLLLKNLKLNGKHPTLTIPTFQGKRIIGNSIHSDAQTYSINKLVTEKYKSELTYKEKNNILKKFQKTHNEILKYKICI